MAEFTCLLDPEPPDDPHSLYGIKWTLNNVQLLRTTEGVSISRRDLVLHLNCTAGRNNSIIRCERVNILDINDPNLLGVLHTLQIQGVLDEVKEVNVSVNCSSISLTWKPPFSFNISNIDPDMMFCIEVYNISEGEMVQLHDSERYCSITTPQYILLTQDPMPTHSYQFRITPRNIVGLGAPSDLINATYLNEYSLELFDARIKIWESQVQIILSMEWTFCPHDPADLSVFIIHGDNKSDTCHCNVNDTEIGLKLLILNNENCTCLHPSTNYTIYITTLEYDFSSSSIVGYIIDKRREVNPKSTITTQKLPEDTASETEISFIIPIVSSLGALTAVMLFTLLPVVCCCWLCYKKKRKLMNLKEVEYEEPDKVIPSSHQHTITDPFTHSNEAYSTAKHFLNKDIHSKVSSSHHINPPFLHTTKNMAYSTTKDSLWEKAIYEEIHDLTPAGTSNGINISQT